MLEKTPFTFEAPDAGTDFRSDLNQEGFAILRDIAFEADTADLRPESDTVIEELADHLKDTSGNVFYVVGHTDASGDFDSNMRLSTERAEAVRDRLIEAGVAPELLKAHGVGPLSPVAPNHTVDGRAVNRRVELVRIASPTEAVASEPADEARADEAPAGTSAAEATQAAGAQAAEAAARIGQAARDASERVSSATEQAEPEPRLIPVPRVVGKWRRGAVTELEAAGFRVNVTGRNVGRVSRQSPAGGTGAEPGSTVNITIGN